MLYLKWLCRKGTVCVLYLCVDASSGIQDWGKPRLIQVKGQHRNCITAEYADSFFHKDGPYAGLVKIRLQLGDVPRPQTTLFVYLQSYSCAATVLVLWRHQIQHHEGHPPYLYHRSTCGNSCRWGKTMTPFGNEDLFSHLINVLSLLLLWGSLMWPLMSKCGQWVMGYPSVHTGVSGAALCCGSSHWEMVDSGKKLMGMAPSHSLKFGGCQREGMPSQLFHYLEMDVELCPAYTL